MAFYSEEAANIKASSDLDLPTEVLDRTIQVAGLFVATVNKIIGSEPGVDAGQSTKLSAVPAGILGALHEKSRQTSGVLSDAEVALNRLNRAFGI